MDIQNNFKIWSVKLFSYFKKTTKRSVVRSENVLETGFSNGSFPLKCFFSGLFIFPNNRWLLWEIYLNKDGESRLLFILQIIIS